MVAAQQLISIKDHHPRCANRTRTSCHCLHFYKDAFLLICLIYKLYNIPRDLAIHSLLSIETLSGRKHHISIDKRMHCETSVAKKGRIQQW